MSVQRAELKENVRHKQDLNAPYTWSIVGREDI